MLFCSLPAVAEVVYIRNQRLAVQQVEGARVVDLDAFRALLTSIEAKRLTSDSGTLTVVNPAGESRTFPLTAYGELGGWEEALQWLGYRRQETSDTGVVDWVNATAGSAASLPKVWSEPSAQVLAGRQEASRRRSGYRAAETNYVKVMDALGKGGTEAQRQWLRRLGYQVADRSILSDLHWTFDIAATPIPNALCTGEGFVVVTEGLLALNLSDDEMAGVLGHEIAHGVRRHSQLFEERYNEANRLMAELRQLQSEAIKAEESNDKRRIQTIKSRYNSLEPRIATLSHFVENQQAYDRHEEEEADVLGIQLATAAGFDPNGEGRALIKLRSRSVELFGQAYQEGSRTHPPLKRRLEIQALVQKRWQAERDRAQQR